MRSVHIFKREYLEVLSKWERWRRKGVGGRSAFEVVRAESVGGGNNSSDKL